MAVRVSDDILKHLDHLLKDTPWKGPPSDLSHLGDPEHLEAFKRLGNYERAISKWIVDGAKQLVASMKPIAKMFRVCSIGCGDGSFDSLVLKELAKMYPTMAFQYVGVDLDERVCEIAEEQAEGIAPNITAETVAEDFQDLHKEDIGDFHLITVKPNCLYYADLLPLLKSVVKLMKPSGELLIISSSRQSFDNLITRFWHHQHKQELNTTEMIVSALQEMSIKYKVIRQSLVFDLTQCFQERFDTQYSQQILDHLTLVKLSDYAPEVSQACVEYLRTIAEGKPDKYLITSVCDMIVVPGGQ